MERSQTDCRAVGRSMDGLQWRMLIIRGEQEFFLEVATPGKITQVEQDNRTEPVPYDESILPLPDVSSEGVICGQLSPLPFSQLEPFLTPAQPQDQQ